MSAFLFVMFALAAIAVVIAVPRTLAWLHSRPSALVPRALLGVILLFVVGLIVARLLVPAEFTEPSWIVLALLLLLRALFFALGEAESAPFRSAQTWVERHLATPLLWAGGVLVAIGIGLGAAQVAETGSLPRPLPLWPPLWVIAWGAVLIHMSRHRASLPPLPEDTGQAYVGALYLRAFKQEARVFAIVASGTPLDALKESHFTDERGDSHFTLEQYLRREIALTLGPFQALGNPEDIFPPTGAMRLYPKDAEWKRRVADLARRATCIVMELGSSGNLRWELEYLRREGLVDKLFVLTPPAIASVTGGFVRAAVDLANAYQVSYRQFAEEMSSIGYQLDPQTDPGPGAVVAFDKDGHAIVLTRGAITPSDFVSPIRARVLGGAPALSPDLMLAQQLDTIDREWDFERKQYTDASHPERDPSARSSPGLLILLSVFGLVWFLFSKAMADANPDESWFNWLRTTARSLVGPVVAVVFATYDTVQHKRNYLRFKAAKDAYWRRRARVVAELQTRAASRSNDAPPCASPARAAGSGPAVVPASDASARGHAAAAAR